MTDTQSFGARLSAAMDEHGPLCVGIDPHASLLHDWGLTADLAGLTEFTQRCVAAFAGAASIVKPQSAFFEQYGSAGVAVLERALEELRDAGTLTLLDVKRGDIGTTMDAYARAHFGDGAPTRADAITLSPFLGLGSLAPAVERARNTASGAFVLALTSNPEGGQVQHSRTMEGVTVAQSMIDGVGEWNAHTPADQRVGDFGLVVGATTGKDIADLGLLEALHASRAPLLAPGLGAQGATADDVARAFGPAKRQVLASASRSILGVGPDVDALRAAVRSTAVHLHRSLG